MGKENTVRFPNALWIIILIVFSAVHCPVVSAQEAVPKSVSELFQSGQKAFEEKRYQDAINDFEAIIERDNSVAAAYYVLGLIYQETSSDLRYPLWYFETAIEIDPEYAPPYDILCRTYYQLQEYYEAESVCTKALELNPDLVSAQLSLAWVYLIGYSDAGQAIHYFEKVVERVQSPIVYFGLGMAYAMNNENGKVLGIVTQLRTQGAEDFANHLEALLRSKRVAEMAPQGFLEHEKSQLTQEKNKAASAVPTEIPQAPETVKVGVMPVPVPVIVRPKISGSPQVHIKGKIRPPTVSAAGTTTPNVYGGQNQRHPGSLSEEE